MNIAEQMPKIYLIEPKVIRASLIYVVALCSAIVEVQVAQHAVAIAGLHLVGADGHSEAERALEATIPPFDAMQVAVLVTSEALERVCRSA